MEDPTHIEYLRRLEEKENERAMIALNLALSQQIASLIQNPAWGSLLDRLRGIEDRVLERLRSSELRPYEIGRIQGMLATIRVFLASARTKTPDELAEDEKRDTILREDIAELRSLLAH